MQLANSKVAEHLSQSMHECSSVQEILQSLQHGSGGANAADVSGGKIHEFEIELDRLQSKVDHLNSQVNRASTAANGINWVDCGV